MLKISVRDPTPDDFIKASAKPSSAPVITEEIKTEVLSKDETDNLLKRAPPIDAKKDDEKAYFKREKSLKPPLKGDFIKKSFPPPVSLEKPEYLQKEEDEMKKELKVLRRMPMGENLNTVPMVSVTFNQPMVPITSVEELKKIPVPIKMTPNVEGEWRWIGTKTVQWKPTHRLPKSTEFSVSVPKGIKSELGCELKEDQSFKFSTIPLKFKSHFPQNSYNERIAGNGIIHCEFNQKIDKNEVIKFMEIRKSKIVLLTTEEVKKIIDKDGIMEKKQRELYRGYTRRLKDSIPEQSIWFTCDPPLPLGQLNYIYLKKGAKGLEGPREKESQDSVYFYTYNTFKVSYHYPTDRIVPMQSWSISLTNNIELDIWSDDFVDVTPKIENMKLRRNARTITITGKTKGRTKYVVKFSPKMMDVYGQYYTGGTVEYNVGPARQSLQGFNNNQMVVIDPTIVEEPEFSFVTVNLGEVRVCVYQAHPSEFHKSGFGSDFYYHKEKYGYYADLTPDQYVNAGKKVFDKVMVIKYVEDEIIETKLKLRDFLQHPREGVGNLIVYIEPTQKVWKTDGYRSYKDRQRIKTWIQYTKLAIDCHIANGVEMYMFGSSLIDGSTIANGKFTVVPQLSKKGELRDYNNGKVSTLGGKDGLGFISNYTNIGNCVAYLENNNDICFVTRVGYYAKASSRVLSYIINDRNLYKPKEIVTIKGILRRLKIEHRNKSLEIVEKIKINYEVFDSRGAKFTNGTIETNEHGSFFFNFKLPDNVNLGQAWVSFKSNTFNSTHYFKIQEFRTPEFSSSCNVDQMTRIKDGVAIVTGKAEYYSGGGLSGCDVDWHFNQAVSTYIPKGWTFKSYSWRCNYYPYDKKGNYQGFPYGQTLYLREKFTDSNGEHKACVEFHGNDDAIIKTPVNITSYCNIKDINRQTMSSQTTFLVHPSEYYVGLKLKKYYAKKGDSVPLDVIVCDIEGNIVPGVDVNIDIVRRESYQKGYEWKTKEIVLEKIKVVSNKEKPNEINIKLNSGGTYHIVATIKDKHGRQNNSSTNMWVAGGLARKGSRIECESIKLIPNAKKYKIGDDAKILLSSPFDPPAEGILFVYGINGFLHKERFKLDNGTSKVVSVKITKNMVPNAYIRVFLTGKSHRVDEMTGRPNKDAPPRPAFGQGSCYLEIPPTPNKIEIEVTPEKKIMKPGEKGKCFIKLKGEKVKNSLISLIIVDEAVLALTGYKIPHPIGSFIFRNYPSSNSYYLRSKVFVKNWSSIKIEAPPIVERVKCEECCKCCDESFCSRCLSCKNCCKAKCKRKCDKKKKGKKQVKEEEKKKSDGKQNELGESAEEKEEIKVRTNFCPLAIFTSDVLSKDDGTATIEFTLPDNLTQYRIWALATNGSDCFGLGESDLQAQLPVAIRPSLPRFLNFGDKAYFTVVVQNQTLDKISVNVGVRMTNLSLIDEKKRGIKAIIPYTKRAELRFYVETKKCGKGKFQIVASAGKFSDAVVKEIPIFTPSTSEAFATYGEVDNDGAVIQSILPPPNIYNDFGGLSVTTSSTALQSLTDAFLYLYNYKFDCVEQIASRMMSIFALQDILEAFSVPNFPKKEQLHDVVSTGVKKIKSAQRSDGSIGFWSLRSDVNIYLSLHVAHTLIRGYEQKGYNIDDVLLNRGKSFCRDVKRWIDQYCFWYGPYSRASLRSFGLYVLTIYHLNKKLTTSDIQYVVKEAETLWKDYEKYLSMEGKAWIIFALFYCSNEKLEHSIVKKVFSQLKNNVNETPETANFITSYGDDGKLVMLHSNRRTDAVLLEVLIHLDKKNYLIPKIVKGLLKHRKKGRWNSTQENVYILIALKKYFKTFENVVPDFIARVWLGDDYCGELKFKGRETDYKMIDIPMKVIVPNDKLDKYAKKDLAILKKGQGRLYYRLAMDYAPKSLKMKPVDYGFIVERTYEGVSKKEHCKYDKDKGMWVFKAGELIRVKLKLTNNSRRYHVALVDFLPAGCEVLNPELKGVASPEAKKEMQMNTRNVSRGPGSGSRGFGRFHWSWYYWRPWYEHTNLRDERVEAFSSYLYCGVHEFSYLMRATSYGTFVIPPTKAEEMYSPELFGRSGSEKVVIM